MRRKDGGLFCPPFPIAPLTHFHAKGISAESRDYMQRHGTTGILPCVQPAQWGKRGAGMGGDRRDWFGAASLVRLDEGLDRMREWRPWMLKTSSSEEAQIFY